MQISICVPTRNRATYLGRCLEHLLTFTRIDFEVVIGDNASGDNTAQVAEEYAARLPSLRYHRHERDIGFARNMDSILRLARGKYVYILSDDDMVFESALVMMRDILEASPSAASVSGKYQSLVRPEVGRDLTIAGFKAVAILRSDYAGWFAMLTRVPFLCDGHPLMRRESFQRHAAYVDRTFALGPLHTQLLATGDLVFVEVPVFQHCRNADSLSTRMTEPWFHDCCHADIELMCSLAARSAPPGTVETIRLAFLKTIYLQSARMALLSGDLTLLWHFLRRAKAVGGVDEGCLARCERDHLSAVVALRLATIISDVGAGWVDAEPSPLLDAVVAQLKRLVPTLRSGPRAVGEAAPGATLRLLGSYDASAASAPGADATVAYLDLVETCRLTWHPVRFEVDGGDVVVRFASPRGVEQVNEASAGYEMLAYPYAASGG